ncbi:MAG: class I SAM-dependent methyltransferase [Cyanobacteria bacterium P01_A01_bin.123]
MTSHQTSLNPQQVVQLNGNSKRQYVRTLFDNIATRYDFLRTIVFLGHTSLWYRQALKDLALQAGDHILDVGCGTGESTRYLSQAYPGITVEGMDLSPGMLSEARRLDPDGTYFEGDVCAIDCPDSIYDWVITAFTFRNFSDKEKSLTEMLRILRPGGHLLILDHFYPQAPHWWQQLYTLWMRRVMPELLRPLIDDVTPYRYLAESIINQLNLADFANLLESFNAEVIQTNTYTGGAAGRLIAVRKLDVF